MKKFLTLLLCLTVTLTMVPSLAFAADDSENAQPVLYAKGDWTTDDGYGSVEGTDDIYKVKGGELNSDGYAQGPYAKKAEKFVDGKITQEIHIAVNVEDEESYVDNSIKFALSSALNDDSDTYTAESTYFLQKTSGGVAVLGSNIVLAESGIYTFRIENTKGENNTVSSKLTVLRGEEIIGSTAPQTLNCSKGEAVSQRYLWFSNINLIDGVMVYKTLPAEESAAQESVKFEKDDWEIEKIGESYGSVEGSDDIYTVKGSYEGTGNDGGYAVGPFSTKGQQAFADGTLGQEINVLIDLEDEDSYVGNGVKFMLSSAMNNAEGNYTAEMSYCLQKTSDGFTMGDQTVDLPKTDVYTFKIVNERNIFGEVYSSLEISRRGEIIAKTTPQKLVCTDGLPVSQRYLWFSSINVKDGVKVYKDVPQYLILDKTQLSVTEGGTAKLTATMPDFAADETVTWTSSDENVATVAADGTVTAVKAGTAMITAEAGGYTAACSVTVSGKSSPSIPGGSTTPTVQKPTIEADANATVTLSSDGTTATITVADGYELADVTVNGVSQGKVTTVTGLKTGDKLVVTTQKKAEAGETEAEKNARLKAGVENTTIKLTSTLGKGFIKLNWKKSAGYKVDYYEVYKSKKRYSGYGTKPYFETKQGGLTGWYKNTKELKKGTRYYYKVRGVRDIAGETVYTQYSNKAWRLVK